MQTLKLKAQPTNTFFATINQMYDGPSQLPTTAEHCFPVCELCSMIWLPLVGRNWKLGRTAKHLIDGSEKRSCPLSIEF